MNFENLDGIRYSKKDGSKLIDDFEWDKYTNDYYVREIKEGLNNDNEILMFKNSYIENNKLILNDNISNATVGICKDILYLKPKSVFECGAGAGYRLYNINYLFPHIKTAGCDLLQSQIDAHKELDIPYNAIKNIMLLDFTLDNAIDKIKEKFTYDFEYIFTQAVVMHLTYNKAILFIKNMIKLNAKYISMYENCTSHLNWDEIFQNSGIFQNYKKVFSWENNDDHLLFKRGK